jgi:threonine/homoserine/homoserine lactone efflux protein
MTIETWIAFISAVFIFAVIPGPTVILVMGQAVTHGKASVIPLIIGVLLGDFVAMTLSLVGLGAALATSATLYAILKWFGVGYLIYLGIKTWREKPKIVLESSTSLNVSNFALFRSSFIVTALNPKDIVFFIAFLPQFVNPAFETTPQFLILMVSFLGVISITITTFALFSETIRHKIQSYQARKVFNKVGGSALIGAGIWASTIQRNQ